MNTRKEVSPHYGLNKRYNLKFAERYQLSEDADYTKTKLSGIKTAKIEIPVRINQNEINWNE